jgi:hypothetical protein
MDNNNVMISYRTPHRATADEISAALDAAGLSPWLDYKGIKPGEKWRTELLKQVRFCHTFVALLSTDYLESEHCRMEIFIARSRGCAVLPVALDDCFDQFDKYEETKGLADTFLVRLYRLSVVGLRITRAEAIQRIVDAAKTAGRPPVPKAVYVSYCNNEADVATNIAAQLERHGVPAWVATRDCRVGDNWRQAQARGVMNASLQVVVLDETIANANVLRTEILLGEAFGLPVVTVLGKRLAQDADAVSKVMEQLRAADITYRRVADPQPFGCDEQSVASLADWLRVEYPALFAGKGPGL